MKNSQGSSDTQAVACSAPAATDQNDPGPMTGGFSSPSKGLVILPEITIAS